MAVDNDEDLRYTGTIVEIDGQYAYLQMHWRDRYPGPYLRVPTLGQSWWPSVASRSRPLRSSGGSGATDDAGAHGDQISVATLVDL